MTTITFICSKHPKLKPLKHNERIFYQNCRRSRNAKFVKNKKIKAILSYLNFKTLVPSMVYGMAGEKFTLQLLPPPVSSTINIIHLKSYKLKFDFTT